MPDDGATSNDGALTETQVPIERAGFTLSDHLDAKTRADLLARCQHEPDA